MTFCSFCRICILDSISFNLNFAFFQQRNKHLTSKYVYSFSFAGHIPSSLSPNIKISEWLPQNDLLGHKDVRAFVSHVGHNSLYESAYHGVPLIAFPLFGDQAYNAKRVEYFGLGLSVDHKTFDDEHLFQRIENVIYDPR